MTSQDKAKKKQKSRFNQDKKASHTTQSANQIIGPLQRGPVPSSNHHPSGSGSGVLRSLIKRSNLA
jgi:hypothetical protein